MTKGLHRLLVLLQSGSEMATFIKKKYETQLAIPHVCLLLLHMEHNCFCLASSVTWKQTFVFFFVTWKHNCFFLASSVTWKHNLHSHALLASHALKALMMFDPLPWTLVRFLLLLQYIYFLVFNESH